MGRPPIGDDAMTAAERQRRHRQAARDNETIKTKHDRMEKAAGAFVAALYDLAKTVARQRARFDTDKAFAVWLIEQEQDCMSGTECKALVTLGSLKPEPDKYELAEIKLIRGSPLQPAAILEWVQEMRKWRQK